MPSPSAAKRFITLRHRVAVRELPASFSNLELWIPVIPETPQQRLLEFDLVSPAPFELRHEPEYGNAMLHARAGAPVSYGLAVEVRYRLERREEAAGISPEAAPQRSPSLFLRYLRSENGLPMPQYVLDLARRLAPEGAAPFERARALFDYCLDWMNPAPRRSRFESPPEMSPLFLTVGNREETQSFFLSLLRAAGLPARMAMGYVFEAREDELMPEVSEPHAWTEVFLPGAGWVTADLECAFRHQRPVFGTLDLSHVVVCRGRHLQLAPSQAGERLSTLAAAYAEVDGRPVRVASALSFRETGVPALAGF
jgi:transglutaminase-like putative cysteine protease